MAVRTMITVAAMINWAVKRGFVPSNPARDVTRLADCLTDGLSDQKDWAM